MSQVSKFLNLIVSNTIVVVFGPKFMEILFSSETYCFFTFRLSMKLFIPNRITYTYSTAMAEFAKLHSASLAYVGLFLNLLLEISVGTR